MPKQTVLAKKRRGPAPTGKGVQVVVRMQPELLAQLDSWIGRKKDAPSRPEAVRRLIEEALSKQLDRSTRAKKSAAEIGNG